MWRGASTFALESAAGPRPKTTGAKPGHAQEQPAPNPTPPLYKQRVARGQEGTGIKVGLWYSSEVTFSLPGMREGVCLLSPSSTQPK